MTISGRPEIGLEDVPWTLAAHRIDVLSTSVDPKMVQILTEIWGLPLSTYATREEGGVKSPIHFHCVLHAEMGGGGPDSM